MRSSAREARRQRRAEQRQSSKIARKAEFRGRAIPTTVEGFKQAISTWGNGVMGNALISRSNQRFERLRDTSPVMQAAALPSLTGFLDLDVAIERLQPGMRVPVSIGSTWVDQIGWGLDSVALSTRFLLCAQMVGACVVARTQLERWSTNLAANHGAPQRSGESTADWLDRIWSIEGAQRLLTWRSEESTDHPVAGLLARQIDARSCYLAMSELLHGSGPLMDVLWWESVESDRTIARRTRRCSGHNH